MITPCPTSKASYPLSPSPLLSLAPASDKSEGCNGMPGPRRGAARWRRPAYLATPRKHKMTRWSHRLIWQPCLLRNQLVPARGASLPPPPSDVHKWKRSARPQINFSRTPNNLACSGIGRRRGGDRAAFSPSPHLSLITVLSSRFIFRISCGPPDRAPAESPCAGRQWREGGREAIKSEN